MDSRICVDMREKVDSRNTQNLHQQADSTFVIARLPQGVVAIHKPTQADP
ncbi:hypothetical protein [Helicobacter canis]|nr:hypothetical protein [Helicobacter canis]